VTSEMK